MTAIRLFADSALLPEGWRDDVLLEVGESGDLLAVSPGERPHGAELLAGPVVPGMANLHSHAFQRAMAGLAERAGNQEESFWSWREVMYGFLARIGPQELEAIATQLYVEMLKAGYTAVGEFHYLHRDPGGVTYEDPAELSERTILAAEVAGIGITQLPVLYGYGGFGGKEAGGAQRRFLNTPHELLAIFEKLQARHGADPQVRIGLAPHSLRAVTPKTLEMTLSGLEQLDAGAPIHIHVAEQLQEVEDCLAWSSLRPVAWLLEHFDLDERWCLVHATHMSEEEASALAASGAVAGLCPTTEANLGDGFFPALAYCTIGGRWGIGSDSHVSVSPAEELRWLEYGQRLLVRRRNVLRLEEAGHIGAGLFRAALAGGAQALGRPIGALAPGKRADLLVLEGEHPSLAGRSGDELLDSFVFAGNSSPVRDVMVGGRWVVHEGRHPAEEKVAAGFRAAVKSLRPQG